MPFSGILVSSWSGLCSWFINLFSVVGPGSIVTFGRYSAGRS